jgi:Fe-S-cluster-containing dehydrogenase component
MMKEVRDMQIPAPELPGDGADSRREFLKHVLSGAATATVLMVYGLGALARASKQEGEEPEHEYAYVINVNNCIGCGNCVRACKRENSVPAGHFRTWVERYVTTGDGVYVESPDGALMGFEKVNATLREKAKRSFTVPKMCNHCENPPCVQVCPVGATFRTPEGFVLIDHEHCIGCAYCVQACPYGARFINPVIRKADKCTWCYHRVKAGKLPACVTVCPTRTRLFGDLKDPDSQVSQIFQTDQWMVLKPAMHTDPVCFYVGLPREVV